jgi:hypothetical protein
MSVSRIARGDEEPLNKIDVFKVIEVGEVVSNDDPYHMGRIKVRIKGPRNGGGDDGILDADLPWCVPLLPKFFANQPKPKEAVFIFKFSKFREFADRMYLGPIISQPDKLLFDPFYTSALRPFTFSSESPNVSIDRIPELKGVFPNPEDVSIQGRYNTDITQKYNEIVLRAGKFESTQASSQDTYPFKFNSNTQGYIQIKNDVSIELGQNNRTPKKGTVTNIVSSKINLITHENGSPRFNVTNQDNLISDDELNRILTEAHQIPFGDVLLQYLILMKEALFYHVHNGNGNQATDLTISGNKQALATFKAKADELEKSMLSKNIRIN